MSFEKVPSNCKICNVYDGDTFTVVYIQNGILCKRRCRCMGYDAPELKTKNPEEKKKAVEAKETYPNSN